MCLNKLSVRLVDCTFLFKCLTSYVCMYVCMYVLYYVVFKQIPLIHKMAVLTVGHYENITIALLTEK